MPKLLLCSNFIVFQCLWFLSVSVGNGRSLFIFFPAVLLHFVFLYLTFKSRFIWLNEVIVISIVACVGCLVEMAFIALGVWGAAGDNILPPIFLVLIWVGFGMTLHVGFDFLKGKVGFCALMGAIFAPMSYIAGDKLNSGLTMVDIPQSLLIIAIIWFFIFPFLMVVAKRFPLLSTDNV